MGDVMMACGCQANSVCTDMAGVHYDPPVPSCVVHSCIDVAPSEPDLSGRVAYCTYRCGSERPSVDRKHLAFFEHRPGEDSDRYYCGCWGWD